MAADTIVALSSGTLPSAIAIIRASGQQAVEIAREIAAVPKAGQVAYRQFLDPLDGGTIDRGLMLRFDAPASVTGEDMVEYHVHGSKAVVDRLLAVLTRHDAVRIAEPGEFTRRALLNGKTSLIETEALSDLLAAETELQRRAALSQMRGGLEAELEEIADRILTLSARAEAAIDYVGDEEEVGQAGAVEQEMMLLRRDIEKLLDAPDRRPLHEGIRVVLAGPANAGKSSLLNRLVGYSRAIVSDEAGTTRDTIEVPVQLEGIAYTFVDTAGLRKTEQRVEREGIERSQDALGHADILLWFGNPDSAPSHPHRLDVGSKADLLEPRSDTIAVSAKTGQGLDHLVERLLHESKSLLPQADGITLNRRHREALAEIHGALEPRDDVTLVAQSLASARLLMDRLLGRQTLDAMLDRIFERFCLGK